MHAAPTTSNPVRLHAGPLVGQINARRRQSIKHNSRDRVHSRILTPFIYRNRIVFCIPDRYSLYLGMIFFCIIVLGAPRSPSLRASRLLSGTHHCIQSTNKYNCDKLSKHPNKPHDAANRSPYKNPLRLCHHTPTHTHLLVLITLLY